MRDASGSESSGRNWNRRDADTGRPFLFERSVEAPDPNTTRLRVDRHKFTLTLFNGCHKIRTFPVGIGNGATPTPVGAFYLTGLFKPPDATTIYGVSIYTLSGFSDVLTNWRLGGIIGLHGTNDPSSIGRNSSHGCIRMMNSDMLKFEKILPLGTPIFIH